MREKLLRPIKGLLLCKESYLFSYPYYKPFLSKSKGAGYGNFSLLTLALGAEFYLTLRRARPQFIFKRASSLSVFLPVTYGR